jgi:hypothetical protein
LPSVEEYHRSWSLTPDARMPVHGTRKTRVGNPVTTMLWCHCLSDAGRSLWRAERCRQTD